MAHKIGERDFVYGLEGQGKDWHGLTQEKPAPLTKELFPQFQAEELQTGNGIKIDRQILICSDDNLPAGEPFNPQTFGYILPQKAWGMVEEAIAGTHYTVERLGMLANRSIWYVSISLDELKEIARPGDKWQFNFSGGLDGSESPEGHLSNIRVVCWNTLSASKAMGEVLFKVRQTIKSAERLEKSKKDVEKAIGMVKVFNATLEQMENTECSIDVARRVYAGELARNGMDFAITKTSKGEERENRARNLTNELTNLFLAGAGNRGESRADLLNGYTQLLTRGQKDSKKNVWRQVTTSEFGRNAARKAEFFQFVSTDDGIKELEERGKKALAIN